LKGGDEQMDVSGFLSAEAENAIARAVAETMQRMEKRAEQNATRNKWITQKEIQKMLGVSYGYIKRLEEHGLHRVQLDEGSKVVFYDRDELDRLLEEHKL
jgi:DNA-directed RNA polymerase specialized sigma subunit